MRLKNSKLINMSGIGVNLRVTGHCSQGGRKYMEDMFSVAYQQTQDMKDLAYAFFGIYDGHGGPQAAMYAKEHLLESIVKQRSFWSTDDEDVLRAIRDGYIATHYAMWKDLASWPKTASGLPSTSGSTATVAFIMRGKIYVGHVGDTAIVLGYQENGSREWKAKMLTKDHKPESKEEKERIEQSGGKVVNKSGVPRVVWNRPKLGHIGPIRRSTPIDEIPFLAVARSLGDFWSYNSALDQFVVSPEPDTFVYPVDVESCRCLVFGTDGLWNMLSPERAITIVQATEIHNEKQVIYGVNNQYNKEWVNPSKTLVDRALERWMITKLRADNTSVVTLMLDPPGPPRAQVLLNKMELKEKWKGENGVPNLRKEVSPKFAIFSTLPESLRNKATTTTPYHLEERGSTEEASSDAENQSHFLDGEPKKRRLSLDKKNSSKPGVLRRPSLPAYSGKNNLCKGRSLEESTRMLRSATPIKTLRSRNIDLSDLSTSNTSKRSQGSYPQLAKKQRFDESSQSPFLGKRRSSNKMDINSSKPNFEQTSFEKTSKQFLGTDGSTETYFDTNSAMLGAMLSQKLLKKRKFKSWQSSTTCRDSSDSGIEMEDYKLKSLSDNELSGYSSLGRRSRLQEDCSSSNCVAKQKLVPTLSKSLSSLRSSTDHFINANDVSKSIQK